MNLGKLGDDNDKDEQMLQDAIAKYGKLIQCYDKALPLLKSNRAENHEHVVKMLDQMGDIHVKLQDWDATSTHSHATHNGGKDV